MFAAGVYVHGAQARLGPVDGKREPTSFEIDRALQLGPSW